MEKRCLGEAKLAEEGNRAIVVKAVVGASFEEIVIDIDAVGPEEENWAISVV